MARVLITDKQRDFRKEVSRLSSIANKRIRRLQESDFVSSPAYQKWLKEGGDLFGIRGKTQAEVWNEYYRVQSYLNSKTSSITGTKQVLDNMNEYTGMNLETYEEIINASSDFFRLADRVSEYLNVIGLGAIYDSGQIYNMINYITQDINIDVEDMGVDGMTNYVTQELVNSYYERNRTNLDLERFKKLE